MEKLSEIAESLGFVPSLQNARIFLSGGTGFIGSAILRSLNQLNQDYGLEAKVVALCRQHAPKFEGINGTKDLIEIHQGDMMDFAFPQGEFSHLIHCAGPTDLKFFSEHPGETVSMMRDSTARILELAKRSTLSRFLYLSSGAVYGPISGAGPIWLKEEQALSSQNQPLKNPYARGKQEAEALCESEAASVETVRARCFALSGRGLPLDKHYALGNFVRDAASGGPIRIEGDGTPFRSYLDAEDLALWLLTLLTRGRSGEAYNVGAESEVSIHQLANLVAQFGQTDIQGPSESAKPGALISSYLPDTAKAQTLGLKEWTPLETSIEAMLRRAKQSC